MADEIQQENARGIIGVPGDFSAHVLDPGFRQWVSQSPALFIILKGPGMIIDFVNDSVLSAWNRSPDMIGKKLLQVFPELKDQQLPAALRKVYDSGSSVQIDHVSITFAKNTIVPERYFRCWCQPVIQGGIISGITVTATEVSSPQAPAIANKNSADQTYPAGRSTQDEIGSHTRLFETITGTTPDLIYMFDLNYRFAYANPALLSMWGKTWDAAIGKTLLENGYEPWHAKMHIEEIDQVVSTGKPIRGEVSFPHATLGPRVYDYIFAPVFNQNGTIEAIAGTTRDITDIKEAEHVLRDREQSFRNLADDSPIFVFIIGPGPTAPVYYWNKTWLRYTGQSLEEAVGNAWNGIIHPDDISIVMQHYVPAFEAHQPYFIPAVRVKRHDGEFRWHAFKGNPRYLQDGIFNGYVGVGFDIHEQKIYEELILQNETELQQKVEARTKELQRSNEDLQQFAHVASHDLQEPLRKVRIFSDRLRKDMLRSVPDNVYAYLDKIDNAAARMSSMISGVLQYSSLNSADQLPAPVDLTEIMRNIVSDLELLVQEKGASIIFGELPVIQGSAVLLHQLFYNLINNSLKFSRSHIDSIISISSELAAAEELKKIEVADQERYWKIIVRDNGIGFEQHDSVKIFQTFSRLHSRDKYEGTGLGLALCRKIAERHGGFISAESKKGEGASFTIFLPTVLDTKI